MRQLIPVSGHAVCVGYNDVHHQLSRTLTACTTPTVFDNLSEQHSDSPKLLLTGQTGQNSLRDRGAVNANANAHRT